MMKFDLLEMKQDIDEDNSRQEEAIAAKEKLDHMNFTSPEYARCYDAYVNLMNEGLGRVNEQLAAVNQARDDLENCGADLTKLDQGRDELEELQHWFVVNRQLLDQEGRQPIKADIK